MRVLTMDENGNLKFADGASDAETSADGEASADGESEAVAGVTFTKTEDVVALTAEVVNVREEPREDARILVQLKAGSTLNRTGISDEWCQVLYNGRTAYVAAAFTEVYEEPETSDTGSEEAEPAAASARPPRQSPAAVRACRLTEVECRRGMQMERLGIRRPGSRSGRKPGRRRWTDRLRRPAGRDESAGSPL